MHSGRTDRRAISPSLRGALALLALLLGPWCQALPDDREQPIHISADEALRDEKQGVTVYSGNVQMNQGSMHIEADRVTIYHVEAEADRIVARGRPAKMRQRPDLEKGPVLARALVIEYHQREQKVLLREEARIEQDGAIVTGDSIDYFIAQELVKADSDEAREGNRVQVVIPPSMQQDLDLAPANEATRATAADPNEAEPVAGVRRSPEAESGAGDTEDASGDTPADSE
jgi:lipopolysaccharide export system protein LptA